VLGFGREFLAPHGPFGSEAASSMSKAKLRPAGQARRRIDSTNPLIKLVSPRSSSRPRRMIVTVPVGVLAAA